MEQTIIEVTRRWISSMVIDLNLCPFAKRVFVAEKIRYVESTPDTIVCCESGEKMMVKEPLPEVIKRAIEYARTIRKAVTE